MLFTPSTMSALWDVWLYRHEETHYLFYLANSRPDRPWDAIGLATSADGVHFDDHGPVVTKAPDAEYLGAGMTWRAGGKFLLNFSECRNGKLEIFFAESNDLRHWDRIPASESVSRMDPRWYADGTTFSDQRWDNIWVLEDAEQPGFFGYVTAVAKDGPEGLRGTCASVRSHDGVHFQTGAPVIEPGLWGDKLEIGGVEPHQGQYFMLAAQAEVPLGVRWSAHHPNAVGGVYVLRSARQDGPFLLDPSQPPLLVSAPDHYTYFARFYRCDGELLVAHHSLSPARFIATVQPKPGTYLAPLKRAQVSDGILRLSWWPGNEAMAGPDLPVGLACAETRGLAEPPDLQAARVRLTAAAGGVCMLPRAYDLGQGVLAEFSLRLEATRGGFGGNGLLIEGERRWAGTAFIADTSGNVAVGPYNGYAFQAVDIKRRDLEVGRTYRWRLLVRGQFVELYIDDDLVQCYSIPGTPGTRLGFITEAATLSVEQIRIRELGC
jgi:hypothetical protein